MCAALAENQLIDLEKEYWEAIKNRDKATVMRLTDDNCIVVGPQGVGELEKKTLAQMLDDPVYDLEQYSFDTADIHVRALSDDAAIVAYKVSERLVVGGKPMSVEAFDSSVWVRRDGGWVCTLHTETIAGGPFGQS
jgi:hypothetical protein